MTREWSTVSKQKPCPACGHPDWCAFAPDGNLKCERSTAPPAGYRFLAAKDNGAVFAPERPASATPRHRPSRAAHAQVDLNTMQARFAAALSDERVDALAAQLGVTSASLRALGIGWAIAKDLTQLRASGAGWKGDRPEGAYTFPERDGTNTIVGFSFRAADGRKGSPSSKVGARRGLIIPDNLATLHDPVLVVEGASDAAACLDMGLAAVGRPSNASGCDDLAVLLHGRKVIVWGENDRKDDANWPGRDGAVKVAKRLAAALQTSVPWALPPEGAKDIRDYLKKASAADDAARREAGRALMASMTPLEAPAPSAADADSSQAVQLVRLAQARYRLGCSTTGDGFAVAKDGPNLALKFNASRSGIGGALRAALHAQTGVVPGSAAVTDALAVLRHHAESAQPEPVHIRVARHEGCLVIDLGDAEGRVAVVSARGWEVRDRSPVLFRRSGLTQPFPAPQRGGHVDDLRAVLNVTHDSWHLLLGWLVASFIPDIAHPILLLRGEQGTGKSTAARFLLSLIDPSGAPLRAMPDGVENWSVTANASWAICIDNVSSIPGWLSDAMCKAVTGDGLARRARYTDNELSVVSFRRVLLLTSIDPGALRGDLADRLLAVDLEPIRTGMRRTEQKLRTKFDADHPQVFGALLDLVAKVLEALPRVRLDELPRMADFAEVLAALDMILGTESLQQYVAQASHLAADVVESDEVARAVVDLAERDGEWQGTCNELLKILSPRPAPRGWPRTPRKLSGHLRRIKPALAGCGVLVTFAAQNDKTRRLRIALERSSGTTAQTAPTARTSPDPLESSQETTPHPWAVSAGNRPIYRPPYRPGPTPPGGAATADSGRLGGVGGTAGDPPSPTPFPDLSPTPPHAATSPNGWPTGGGGPDSGNFPPVTPLAPAGQGALDAGGALRQHHDRLAISCTSEVPDLPTAPSPSTVGAKGGA